LGYRIAPDQQSLTPLQRKVLVYGYLYLVRSMRDSAARTVEPQSEVRDLSELVGLLPKRKE
jgi:hypothetical protein